MQLTNPRIIEIWGHCENECQFLVLHVLNVGAAKIMILRHLRNEYRHRNVAQATYREPITGFIIMHGIIDQSLR